MNDGDEPVVGRVRRGRGLVAIALGLGLLAAMPYAFDLLGGGGAGSAPNRKNGPTAGQVATLPMPAGRSPIGHLVYVAADLGLPGARRLWVLDVATGSLEQGPVVPAGDELWAVGPGRSWLVLIGHGTKETVAYLLREPSTGAEPVEVARGDLITLSSDGQELLVADVETAAPISHCLEPAYGLERVILTTASRTPAFDGRYPCGVLADASLGERSVVLTVVRNDLPVVYGLGPERWRPLLEGLGHVAVLPTGTVILVRPRTGELLVWPGGGAPRPLVTGGRLVPRSVLAWASDGRHLIVNGSLDGASGTWLVDVAAGTARLLVAPAAAIFRGAVFNASGTAFLTTPNGIVIASSGGVVRVPLPEGAPAPLGPIAWLP